MSQDNSSAQFCFVRSSIHQHSLSMHSQHLHLCYHLAYLKSQYEFSLLGKQVTNPNYKPYPSSSPLPDDIRENLPIHCFHKERVSTEMRQNATLQK